MNFQTTLFFLLFFLFNQAVLSQSDSSQQSDKIVSDLLIGKCQRKDLQRGEFAKYFFNEYSHYTPKKEITEFLKNKIYSYSITIVLGTWCSDSREQVPRFIKILDELDYNTNSIEIFCVNHEKSAGIDISYLKIDRVPTIIFFKEGIEMGRITETPYLTLEEDIYNIVKK